MKIVGAILLFVFWLLLSDSFDLAHVGAGAFFAGLVMWLQPTGKASTHKMSLLATLGYLPWLTGRILKSGLHVSRLILDPKLPISPKLIRHKTKLQGDGELVVLGNSITLTPGTITVEIAPGELVVHAIDESSSTDLTEGVLDARVDRMFTSRTGAQ